MSPSSGHILIPEAVKAFKYMVSRGAAYLKARLPQGSAAARAVEAIPVRISKQPLHPLAALRQSRSQHRNFSTAIRRIISSARAPIQASRPIAGSAVRSAITKGNLAPFSSPLRPNLTGGALPRSSGGYSLGGNGIRHFSSTPAAQAHVVQNVTAAVRAFCINGYKVQYDGTDKHTGNMKFKAVSQVQAKAMKGMNETKTFQKGTSLEFRIAPTITAVPAAQNVQTTLDSAETISTLASDFAHSLSSLAMVHADLKKLATLGSLPINYPNPHTLSVRFAGCDASTVHALCNELGIRRGIVREDPEWAEEEGDKDVEMALLFPWAPSRAPTEDLFYPTTPERVLNWQDMVSKSMVSSDQESMHDDYSVVHTPLVDSFSNPWHSAQHSASFDALNESDVESNEELTFGADLQRLDTIRTEDAAAYEGMEGMLRFFEQCEARR